MGLRERPGCSNKEGLFGEREKLGGFTLVSGSEKVIVERESFGSGEVAQFIGFNDLLCKSRKLCKFKKMLISATELTTSTSINKLQITHMLIIAPCFLLQTILHPILSKISFLAKH